MEKNPGIDLNLPISRTTLGTRQSPRRLYCFFVIALFQVALCLYRYTNLFALGKCRCMFTSGFPILNTLFFLRITCTRHQLDPLWGQHRMRASHASANVAN